MQSPTIVAIPPRNEEGLLDERRPLVGPPAATTVPAPREQPPEGPRLNHSLPDSSPPPLPPGSFTTPIAANSTPTTNGQDDPVLYRVATASSAWQYDDQSPRCNGCGVEFNALNRRHHCRYCGRIFCHNCSDQRALIPPTQIVLHPSGGKKITSGDAQVAAHHYSFSPDPDPDRMLTYVATNSNRNDNVGSGDDPNHRPPQQTQTLLTGKGLEERLILAREPIRVCRPCHAVLQPLQPDLIRTNSNAMRYNWIDPTDVRRLFNSPIAFTLGHEIRKAAYTLNNLLPLPKRRPGALFSDVMHHNVELDGIRNELQQQCRDQCHVVAEEHVKIPALLLEKAKGIAVVTVLKGGFGVAGFEVGTGLVVVRLGGGVPQQHWSAPSAIGLAGVCWGALIGAQVSDHVFLLMTDEAVHLMMSGKQQVQLGADVGVAVGPVGRTLEGGWGVGGHAAGAAAAPIYTYSLSKGLYAGASLDGMVVTTRDNVNEKFYGYAVRPEHILNGSVPAPPAAQPLYEALQRCHVYASVADQVNHRRVSNNETAAVAAEYGEFQNSPFGSHSVITSLSDITNDR